MLVIPMIYTDKDSGNRSIISVRMELSDAEKIREGVHYNDAKPGQILMMNQPKYLDDSSKKMEPVDYMRGKSLGYSGIFLITTQNEKNSDLYDVYKVVSLPPKVNDDFDQLYNKGIIDMQKEIPGINNRGRYVSFEKLGIEKYLSDEKIAKLQKIVENSASNQWDELLEEEKIADLRDITDFIKHFKFTLVSDKTIPTDSIEQVLDGLSVINSRDYRNLNNYKKMAEKNTEIFTKLSLIHQLLHNQPILIDLPPKQKRLVKSKDANGQAA